MKVLISLCLAFFLFSFGGNVFAYSISQRIGDNEFCTIAKVDDGDTFDLDCATRYYPNVRLLGVNTPDKNQKTGKKSCFYDEAKKILEKHKGRIYKVEFYGSDLCKDPYKGCRHLVRLIDIERDYDLGERMVKSGYAFSWTNFSVIPDSIETMYESSEVFASEKKLWLWGKCDVKFYDDSKIDSSQPDKMTY
jgi:endonuclease YncB( thermonuclease family)